MDQNKLKSACLVVLAAYFADERKDYLVQGGESHVYHSLAVLYEYAIGEAPPSVEEEGES